MGLGNNAHLCNKAAGGRFLQTVGGIPSVKATVFFIGGNTDHQLRGQCQQARRIVALSIRLPQEPHPPRRAHGPEGDTTARCYRVVSKCALRE